MFGLWELCCGLWELCRGLWELCHTILELCRTSSLLPYLVPVLLLAVPGQGIKVLALLYYVTLACCVVKVSVAELIRCLSSALASLRHGRSRLWEAVSNSVLCPFRGTTAAPAPKSPTPVTGTTVTPNPTTNTAVTPTLETPTLVTGTMVTPTLRTNTVVVPTLVTPTRRTDTVVAPVPTGDTTVTPTPVSPTPVTDTEVTPTPVTETVGSPTLETPTPVTDTVVTPTPATPTLAMGTTVTPTSVTDTAVTPAPVTPTPETPTPMTDTVVTPTLVTPTPVTDTAATPTPATGTVATATPATDAAVTPALMTSTVVTPSLVTPATDTVATPPTLVTPKPVTPAPTTGTTADPQNQLMLVPLIPLQKKWTQKSTRVERGEEAPPKEEEEEDKMVTSNSTTTDSPTTPSSRSLSWSKLWGIRKDFGRRPGEAIATWLLRCWDNGAGRVPLGEGDAWQEGSLAKDGGVDMAISKGGPARSLWWRLVEGARDRYPLREEVLRPPGEWATVEGGVQLLRELAVCQVVYGHLKDTRLPGDPDDVRCSRAMWREVVQRAAPSCADAWAVLDLGGDDDKVLTVREVVAQLRSHQGGPSMALQPRVPAVEKLPELSELRRELKAMGTQWFATIHISNAFLSIPPAPECQSQVAFTWRGVQYTWNQLPPRWKRSPAICHGLVKALLEKGGAPEHRHYVDDIIVWGDSAAEVVERGRKIIELLVGGGFTVTQSEVRGPTREVTFLGVKLQGGRQQIPVDVVNQITATAPPTSEKETQEFLDLVGSWQTHIPNYSQIVTPLCQVTPKKKNFRWGPAQQQAFDQIKQEVAHAVALRPVRLGPEVKNVLYTAAREHGPTWSLWQKVPGESQGQPLGFWSREYRGSECRYTRTEKEILAAYEGVRAASRLVGPQAQLLLAPSLPVLGWVFQGKGPTTAQATDVTWSTWVELITQRARAGHPTQPGILEVIVDSPKGSALGMALEEDLAPADDNKLPDNEGDVGWDL